MAKKVDWDRMYKHLGRVSKSVDEDLEHGDLVLKMGLSTTLERDPPRIYVCFGYPDGFVGLQEDFSLGAEEKHREGCLELISRIDQINEIMKKHGLRKHQPNPNFKKNNPCERGRISYAYGYNHEDYKI